MTHRKDLVRKYAKNTGLGHLHYRLKMVRMKGRTLTLSEEEAMMKIKNVRRPCDLYEGSLSRSRCFDDQGNRKLLNQSKGKQ